MTDLTVLTIEELHLTREGAYTEKMRRDVDAELRRREQAQHTPGRWQVGYSDMRVIAVGPEPCIVADCAADSAVTPERAAANAALIARAPELAAEGERLRKANKNQARNYLATVDAWEVVYAESQRRGERIIELEREVERLRGLLAQITAIAEDSLDLARDRHAEASYARRLAAIEAAKEATNAQK